MALSALLNLIGMTTGIALYAMLLVMVVRARRVGSAHPDPLLLGTAVLGLLWNLSALPAYELPKIGIHGPLPLLTLVGYTALGFLPAVVVQSVLRGERGMARGWLPKAIAVTAYAVAAIASTLHARAAWEGAALPSEFGMRLLTYTFIGLVVPLAMARRGQPGARRTLWAAALSVFAVSALHLSKFHEGDASWPVELLGHHASLPLAFAILYQDFPFALADLFLKRALTLVVVVSTAFVAVVSVQGAPPPGVAPVRNAGDVALLVTLWVATALLYPRLQQVVAWFVDSIILKRPDYSSLVASISAEAERSEDIATVLDAACGRLAPALSAGSVRWVEHSAPAAHPLSDDARDRAEGVAAAVEIPVAEPPGYELEIARLTAGRRLLSDDRAAIDSIAALLARRIDAIRLAHERYEGRLREQEIGKLATEAELRALRAQINPHFLFNALTTIGYLIQTAPSRALETLMRLTALLRSVLRSEGESTTLGRELDLVESYLDIERARFEHRLRVRVDVPLVLHDIPMPPLLLQPIVENAVKHGIGPERSGGEVVVTALVERNIGRPDVLALIIRDSGSGGSADDWRRGRQAGVGLNNIERRLTCQYGDAASLRVRSTPGLGTVVEVRLPVQSGGARDEKAAS